MPITREPDYPPEAAALVDAFSHCAQGHDMLHVVDAAANFFIAALTNTAKAHGLSLEQAQNNARKICNGIISGVADNWDRKSLPTDVSVSRN